METIPPNCSLQIIRSIDIDDAMTLLHTSATTGSRAVTNAVTGQIITQGQECDVEWIYRGLDITGAAFLRALLDRDPDAIDTHDLRTWIIGKYDMHAIDVADIVLPQHDGPLLFGHCLRRALSDLNKLGRFGPTYDREKIAYYLKRLLKHKPTDHDGYNGYPGCRVANFETTKLDDDDEPGLFWDFWDCFLDIAVSFDRFLPIFVAYGMRLDAEAARFFFVSSNPLKLNTRFGAMLWRTRFLNTNFEFDRALSLYPADTQARQKLGLDFRAIAFHERRLAFEAIAKKWKRLATRDDTRDDDFWREFVGECNAATRTVVKCMPYITSAYESGFACRDMDDLTWFDACIAILVDTSSTFCDSFRDAFPPDTQVNDTVVRDIFSPVFSDLLVFQRLHSRVLASGPRATSWLPDTGGEIEREMYNRILRILFCTTDCTSVF